MSCYDYKAGKKRIKEILDSDLEVIEKDKIPKNGSFTFDNAYYGWVTAIFVDIRNSSDIFSKKDKVEVSKMIRSFTSEIIEILRGDDNEREIGIRGDCVYAIYTTPLLNDEYKIADKSFVINTYMNMLNKLLREKGYSKIKVGIGVATSQELVVKAGRKGVGINNSIWIGDAVTKASNLSGLGNKDDVESIVYSKSSYDNFIKKLKTNNEEKNVESWFRKEYSDDLDCYFYHANVINVMFNDWVDEGMPD